MTNKNNDSSQGEGAKVPPPPPAPTDQPLARGGNKVYKSGPLFLSSRGIGWTSWKKRWFILTRTSLVFFRSDPNAIPQKGAEVNLTLGGIDLNSSGSVVVKEDKKLLTVLFPDGRDGRAFTLKAETSEDLYEWKAALEEALASAPSAALVMGQNGIFRNDQANAADATSDNSKDRQPVKSLVVGRPILLALEDIDGTPSFLEKALKFLEEHGVRVEGILRQAADVDDVESRIREYEQGKNEFSPEEDPHVIADCIKYVLRELPSSPVPASCCNALLEAFRTERSTRVGAMRSAICETFPEPNRRLLQRILMMMQTVASHKSENRMSISAVAACMAPLLLRPLLAGDCELENDFDMCGDGSVQLLQAAAAANHAQAIVITLLEEYDNLFGEGSVSAELYSDSEGSGSESEELTEDDESYEDDDDDADGSDADIDEDFEHDSSGTASETCETEDKDDKGSVDSSSGSKSPEAHNVCEVDQKLPTDQNQTSLHVHDAVEHVDVPNQSHEDSETKVIDCSVTLGVDSAATSTSQKSNGPVRSVRRPAVWGRTPAKKNLSMESIDIPSEDEAEILKLEITKTDLQNRIAEEAKGNALLQESLERRKNALRERRLALEKDVARLQEQLQKERELRTALEAGLKVSQGALAVSSTIDERMKLELDEIAQAEADVTNLKEKANDLELQLDQQRELNSRFRNNTSNHEQSPNILLKLKDKQKDIGGTARSCTREKSVRSKHDMHHMVDGDKGKMQEPVAFTNKKNQPPIKQRDPVHSLNSLELLTTSSAEPGLGKPVSSHSRKSGAKSEAANSTASALSKLTNRLNFLKERRTQIANELQNMDKGRTTSQPSQNLGQGKGSESHHVTQNLDVSQRSGQPCHNPDTQPLLDPDRGRNSESIPGLHRGKSESFPNAEKSRNVIPPRTYSR